MLRIRFDSGVRSDEVGFRVEEIDRHQIRTGQGCANPHKVFPAARTVLHHKRSNKWTNGSCYGHEDCVARRELFSTIADVVGNDRLTYVDIMAARSWRKNASETIPGTMLYVMVSAHVYHVEAPTYFPGGGGET